MPAADLNYRKKGFVQELNGFIGLKKAYSGATANRNELLDGPAQSEADKLLGAFLLGVGAGCRGGSAGCGTCGVCCLPAHLIQMVLLFLPPCGTFQYCLLGYRPAHFAPLGRPLVCAALHPPPRHAAPPLSMHVRGGAACCLPSAIRSHIFTPASTNPAHPHPPAGMSTVELMQTGRQDMKATDAALLRSEKLVNDTMAIGIGTAETLQGQTRQLEKVRRG